MKVNKYIFVILLLALVSPFEIYAEDLCPKGTVFDGENCHIASGLNNLGIEGSWFEYDKFFYLRHSSPSFTCPSNTQDDGFFS